MNAWLDDSLVALMVLACSFYAFAKLGPSAARRVVQARLAAFLARVPAPLGLGSAARRLARAAEDKAPGACGGCDSCGSATRRPATPAGGAEIGVPIASIPRARRARQE
jgi:hypothetical protein